MPTWLNKLLNLINIKSIVTIILSAVFAVLAINGTISTEFMTIYTMVITFYFSQANQSGGGASASQ